MNIYIFGYYDRLSINQLDVPTLIISAISEDEAWKIVFKNEFYNDKGPIEHVILKVIDINNLRNELLFTA